ncbi:MAG: NUDIX hydrolase [Enterococcus lemanii]
MRVKLISHALISNKNQYLLIKRSSIKRGKKNVYPLYWDIPGGSVEDMELPREGALRETFEEVGLRIIIKNIIHEDSNLDKQKNIIFTRLVYEGEIKETDSEINITLDPEEHLEYRWINSLEELKQENIVPYVEEIFKNLNERNMNSNASQNIS